MGCAMPQTKEQLLGLAKRLQTESRPTYGSGPASNEFAAHVIIPALTLREAVDAIKALAESY